MRPIYLDYNATTPVDQRVLEAMLPWFSEKFGNAASSTHAYGWEAEEAVKIARESISKQIGADSPDELVFTSGSTEAINLGLKGVAELYGRKGNHFITAKSEHKAVLDTFAALEKTGSEVTYLDVDAEGGIDLSQFRDSLREDTVLVSLMLANNETGVLHPLREISEIVHEKGAIMMSDATQCFGKIPVDVNELGIDLMCLSAHKFYGPKGVGALYLRKRRPRVVVGAQIHGGGHERGFRSGTLNVAGIVGMGKALELATEGLENGAEQMKRLRDHFESAILALPDTRRNGSAQNRLPNTSNLSFGKVDADALLMAMRQIAVSTGSACTSAVMEPSHVLKAMGIEDEAAFASIRFSLGRFTSEEDIDRAIEVVKKGLSKLRR